MGGLTGGLVGGLTGGLVGLLPVGPCCAVGGLVGCFVFLLHFLQDVLQRSLSRFPLGVFIMHLLPFPAIFLLTQKQFFLSVLLPILTLNFRRTSLQPKAVGSSKTIASKMARMKSFIVEFTRRSIFVFSLCCLSSNSIWDRFLASLVTFGCLFVLLELIL